MNCSESKQFGAPREHLHIMMSRPLVGTNAANCGLGAREIGNMGIWRATLVLRPAMVTEGDKESIRAVSELLHITCMKHHVRVVTLT